MERDRRLDLLALGYNCHRCGAGADESCRKTNGTKEPVDPHQTRINWAVKKHHESKKARELL